ECVSLPADLSRMDGIEALAKALLEREHVLDILVNNAGASWGGPIDDFPEVGWDKVMDTNVKAVFFLTQKLMPLLRAAGAGPSPARVINIGSIDGIKASAFDAWSYGASKAAVHHLTRFMASRLTKERIVFNAIAPGPYPTVMLSSGVGFGGKTEGVDWDSVGARNPSGRVGTPQDIAGLATFLCSRAGEYVVGQVIASDGGIVAAA
ncbi:MAG TPA: SDR family oxidoreductase, partial [Burkholderiaceae bacterium]